MVARETGIRTSRNDSLTIVSRSRNSRRFLEPLESRVLMSATLFVTLPGVPTDATHYHTLQAALLAAATGDTIHLQPGFSPGSFVTTSLTQTAAAGATTIRTAAALEIGDVVSVGNNVGGDTLERALVTAVAPTGSGDFQITLATPLLLSHTGSVVDADNGTLGPALGIGKGITLTADAGVVLPFSLEIWATSASSQTVLTHLNMGNQALFVDGNSSVISDCTISAVVVAAGAQSNTFFHNTFNVTSGDGISLEHADGTMIDSNAFNVTSPSAFGVVVHNSGNVIIVGNQIMTGLGGTGVYISVDDSQNASVDLRDNTIQTTDGFGIFINKLTTGSTLQARIQGNVLNNNAIGVFLLGDGTSIGAVDLGGGSTLFGTSTGGNDFSGFTSADDSHFAVGLFNTSGAAVVTADSNVWGVAIPLNVVADATHTLAAGGSGVIVAAPVVQQETIDAHAVALAAVETGSTSGIVASFTSNLVHGAGDFTVTIDWGDGTSSAGTVVANASGGFNVTAGHTWGDAGTFGFSVTILSNSGTVALTQGSAAIADRSIDVTGVNITTDKNKTFSGTVATFTDNLASTTAASYVAAVAWSDGVTSTATITRNADGSFSIKTSRSFSKAGVIVASISVATVDGVFSGLATMTANITNGNGCKVPPKCIHQIIKMIKHCTPKHAPPRRSYQSFHGCHH